MTDIGKALNELHKLARTGPNGAKLAGLGFAALVFMTSAQVAAQLLEKIKQDRQRKTIYCRPSQLKDPFFD